MSDLLIDWSCPMCKQTHSKAQMPQGVAEDGTNVLCPSRNKWLIFIPTEGGIKLVDEWSDEAFAARGPDDQ